MPWILPVRLGSRLALAKAPAPRWRTLAFAALALPACPTEEQGECFVDADCTGRAQVCDVANATCTDAPFEPHPTGEAEGDFAALAVPFFRGRMCTVKKAQAGAPIPVSLEPCLHPCLDVTRLVHWHFFECVGSQCQGWPMLWATASGKGCPSDVFGKFDRALCAYPKKVSFDIKGLIYDDGSAILGSLVLEQPYLTNDDASRLASREDNGTLDAAFAKSQIFQYPASPGRSVTVEMQAGYPQPPKSCADTNDCDCVLIGF